jgi:membrane protease YdiL (CAAX protease family)
MQRLLRGWVLYAVFGLLVVLVYAWSRAGVHVAPIEEFAAHADQPTAPEELAEDALQWFPGELELEALPRLMTQQPLLGAALLSVTAGAFGLALAGFGLTLWGVWTGRSQAAWRFPSRPLPAWSFGELARIVFLTVAVAMLLPFVVVAASSVGLGPPVLDAHLRITVSMLVLDAAAILIVAAFAVGKGPSVRRTFGLSGPTLLSSILVGLRGYVTMFPWLFVVLFLVVEAAHALGLKPPIEPIQELLFREDRPLVLGLTAVLACLLGPVAEELFFRGVVFSTLRRRSSRTVAMLVSAAAFALMHGNPVGFPSILLLGCLLANLYERTGSLASSLSVHILHNTLLLSAALIVRRLAELA